MARLRTTSNLERADDFYAALIAAHEGRSPAQSEALNARLILILANHIGDLDVLAEALDLAVRPDRRADGTAAKPEHGPEVTSGKP